MRFLVINIVITNKKYRFKCWIVTGFIVNYKIKYFYNNILKIKYFDCLC